MCRRPHTFVTPSNSRALAAAISSTAASNAAAFFGDGCRYPEIFRTYCSAASRISSSDATTSRSRNRLMLSGTSKRASEQYNPAQ